MNHIAGPIKGKYVAAFTVPCGDDYFVYAKITAEEPHHVWDGTPAVRWLSAGPFCERVTSIAIILDVAATAIGMDRVHD